MTKRLLPFLFLLTLTAVAQNIRYDNVALGPKGPVPNASIAVCLQPANTSTAPCSLLSPLCSSLSDTSCTSPNPFFADALGNFHFYVRQGPVTVQIYGPGISSPTILADQVAGTGQNASASYSVAPSILSYGTVQVGTSSSTQNIIIANSGTVPLTITSVALSGSTDFSDNGTIGSCNGALAVGASCTTVTFTFNPTQAISESATATVNVNGLSPQAISLTGTGQAAATFPLTVSLSGTGAGTATSNETPPLINCSLSSGSQAGNCSANYSSGATPTLTFVPGTGSNLGAVSGACTTSPCTVTMNQAQSVSAVFSAVTSNSTLTITGGGNGAGSAISNVSVVTGQGPLNCTMNNGVATSGGGAGCSGAFTTGTVVQLTETPSSGSQFSSWGGPLCQEGTQSGSTCTITVNADITVTVSFALTTPPLSFVQGATCITGTNTVKCTWTGPNHAGDLIACGANWSDITTTVSSVADTSGNTYTQDANSPKTLTDLTQVIYYSPNILAAAGGANTTTFTLSANASNRNARCVEYGGVVTSLPVDVSAAATGSSALPASGNAITTLNNDLLVGFTAADNTVLKGATNFVQRVLQNNTSSNGSFSLVQFVKKTNCSSGVTTCAVTVASTGAGNLIVAEATLRDNTTQISSVSGGGTYTVCCYQYQGNVNKAIQAAYTTASTSGATTITFTWNAAPASGPQVLIYEISYSGASIAFDTSGTAANTGCTSCVGPALTLTGTNDAIIQASSDNASVTAISSPYTLDGTINFLAEAHALNISSGAAATWTLSASSGMAMNALAFKGTSATTGADLEDQLGVVTGTYNFQPTLSASATWIASLVAFKAQTTVINPNTPVLTLTCAGTGNGSYVTNLGNLANCACTAGVSTGTCSAPEAAGTSVQVVGTAGSGSVFAGWSGVTGCSSSTSCTFNMPTSNVTMQGTFNSTGAFTITNQQPVTVVPYSGNPNSVTTKRLPADVMSHLMTNSDSWVKNSLQFLDFSYPNNMGFWKSRGQGSTSDQSTPFYYTSSADSLARWYRVVNSSGATVFFLAPNNAAYGINQGDHSIAGWDQTNGILYKFYVFNTSTTPDTLGSCSCTYSMGSSCACAVTVGTQANHATGLTATDPDWGISSSDPDGLAAWAGKDREHELLYAEQVDPATAFHHATHLETLCVNTVTSFVFPATGPACKCGSQAACTPNNTSIENAVPPTGALIFLDYTDNQIASMGNLLPWQKALVYQMAHYGGYIDVTGGIAAGISWQDSTHEGSHAWVYYQQQGVISTSTNDDFLTYMANKYSSTWSLSTGAGQYVFGNDATLGVDGTIPRLTGPGGTDIAGNSCSVSPGCGFSGHIHIADPCIVKGYAGQVGGCF